ncbi:MAG: hypothetical protein H6925_04535 [Holosporaceae bacterium]|nr:MAG: hypothetical protein H6925_04535 [Holosporaceae bacterium]
MSVGSGQAGQPHQYRRITHVASPIDDHDAATKGYVDQDKHVQVKNLDDQVNKVNAMRMSTANARIHIPEGKSTAIGIGVGSYQQAKATTLAVKQRGPGRFNGLQLSGNFTLSNTGDKAGGAGIGYAF